jgi:16S rRNA (guanine966-N2)-methyltransferase
MRVIAGSLRGRRLHTAPKLATRPTSERARAGLFDWIGARIGGAAVLDLFAGSGSVGIEALSRGAERVTFVESARAACAALRRNVSDLELVDAVRLLPYDVRRGVRTLLKEGARFDFVFADPPYGQDAAPWMEPIEKLLTPEGDLVIERSARDPESSPAPGLVLRGSRAWGETRFDWYQGGEGQGE